MGSSVVSWSLSGQLSPSLCCGLYVVPAVLVSSFDECLMSYSPRIVVLITSAVVILGLCTWRTMIPRQTDQSSMAPQDRRPAPSLQLYDQESTLVKLDAYLSRHRIVIVFFDGQAGPESNSELVQLRQFYPALKSEGIIVLGISTALPQENRNNSFQPFPFPLLTDEVATSTNSVHRTWGRFVAAPSLDTPAGTKPGVFLIDRAGLVPWQAGYPFPESSTETLVARLLEE